MKFLKSMTSLKSFFAAKFMTQERLTNLLGTGLLENTPKSEGQFDPRMFINSKAFQ